MTYEELITRIQTALIAAGAVVEIAPNGRIATVNGKCPRWEPRMRGYIRGPDRVSHVNVGRGRINEPGGLRLFKVRKDDSLDVEAIAQALVADVARQRADEERWAAERERDEARYARRDANALGIARIVGRKRPKRTIYEGRLKFEAEAEGIRISLVANTEDEARAVIAALAPIVGPR